MSTSLVIPGKLKLKKYIINNAFTGPDIINYNLNPIIINDATAATTTANAYTQVKSYSGIGGVGNVYGKYMVNAIRIQVYGYVSAGTGYVEIEVDGSTSYTVLKAITGTATGTSFTNTSSALLIDAIIALNPNTSHTIAILAYNSTSGNSTTISSVYGFQGYAITSTSLTQIDSETLQNYILDEIGFKYDTASGIRAAAFVNRSTSATATLQLSDNFTQSGQYGVTLTAPAGNDAANAGYWMYIYDNNNVEQIPTGYNGSWTWSAYGEVGASGDVLLIGNLYIWFGIHTVVPPSDLLASFAIIALAIPGLSNSIAISPSYAPPGRPNTTFYYDRVYTLLSPSNSNSATSPNLAVASVLTPPYQLTTDEMIYCPFSARSVLAYFEIEAVKARDQ